MAERGEVTRIQGLAETDGLLRMVYGLAYAARPRRLMHPLGFARIGLERLVRGRSGEPFLRAPEEALSTPDGLVDMGGPKTAERLGRLLIHIRLCLRIGRWRVRASSGP